MAYEYMLIAAAALIGLVVVTATALKGWQGWLALKMRELDQANGGIARTGGAASRIELADLRERVRKLEAIAEGVDL
jgi:hypothetical protein